MVSSAPKLTRRFAVYAAIALIAATGGIFWFVRGDAVDNAERDARYDATLFAGTTLRDRLRPSDLSGPVSARRSRQLDQLFRSSAVGRRTLRVKLYGAGNRVVYSNDPASVGTKSDDPAEIEEALAGEPVGGVTQLNKEGGGGRDVRALETYVPVHVGHRAGVFEIYQDYAPIAAAARRTFIPLVGVLVLVMLALYLSFFPILHRVTGRLRRQMSQIQHQADHDGLTGLPNRTLLRRRLDEALTDCVMRRERFAVLLMDLDRFKEINDALGHESGDRLLCDVASQLDRIVGERGTVARLGGDEFAVVAPGVGTPAEALVLARELNAGLSRSRAVEGLQLQVDSSIGIALYPRDGEDGETLLRHADIAMYASKEAHVPKVYSPRDDHYSPERLALMSQLRNALDTGQLVVHYQPQADLLTGEIHSVEALVRWDHPERGLLPPAEFIPLAEHTGLIRDLTRYVLDRALGQCRAWADAGIELAVAVNITGRDLLDLRFPNEVAELLAKWIVPPSRLELEITENTVLTDPRRARIVLDKISRLGVQLAIDDFGSGNSSLGYLKRLPVSVLKIDKSFVLHMLENCDDATIVRSTVDLGHNLGLRVVAEGVETEEAWQRLRELHCDIAQGFLLSRPVPAEEIELGQAERAAAAA
jgi:diguanylate cyclase